jgi:FG-GAP-like repeat
MRSSNPWPLSITFVSAPGVSASLDEPHYAPITLLAGSKRNAKGEKSVKQCRICVFVLFITVALEGLAFAGPGSTIADHQFHSLSNRASEAYEGEHAGLNHVPDFRSATAGSRFPQDSPPKPGSKRRVHSSKRAHPNSNPPVGKLGFVAATQVPAGGGTYWDAALGDFNGDGIADAATFVETADVIEGYVNFGTAVSIVLSNGDGTFQPPVLTRAPDSYYIKGFFVGDVDGDKKDDVLVVYGLVSGETSSVVNVLISNGDGTFTQGNTYVVSPNDLTGGILYDVNGDGHLDFVAVDLANDNSTPSNILTMFGNGDGTFSAPPTTVVLSGEVFNAVFADLNGDHLLDITAFDQSNQLAIYMANSSSTYSNPVALSHRDNWSPKLTVGDLTGDGKPEIVTPNDAGNNLTVYVNNGDGTFQTGVDYNPANTSGDNLGAAITPDAVAIADVNGDGKADLVSSNSRSQDITVLFGNGDGTFTVPTFGYAFGGKSMLAASALVADFNRDGYPDILVPDQTFSLTLLKGYGDGTFRAALDYYAVPCCYSIGVASGDFNGDGLSDFVVGIAGQSKSSSIVPFLSNSTGIPTAGFAYGLAECIGSVAVADFNQDGKLDFAATDTCSGTVQVFNGNGDGTFIAGATFPTSGVDPGDLVAADLNGDGYPDVAVINLNWSSRAPTVGVLLNDKTGNFESGVSYGISSYVRDAITAGDLNGDGKIDLIVTYGATVAVLTGNGDGTFQPETDMLLGDASTNQVAVADTNGDGIPDMLVALHGSIAIFLGSANGGFGAPSYLPTSLQDYNLGLPFSQALQITDVDGDGNLDLVYTNWEYGTVGVLFGKGGGTFYDPVEFPVGREPWRLAVGDMNGDGTRDEVAASESSPAVTVLLNANGSGTKANYSVTAPTTSATITAGSSAVFTLSLAPSNHYNGTVTFACSNLPPSTTCSFNPELALMNGDTPLLVQLTVKTTAAGTPQAMRTPATRSGGSTILMASLSMLGLFGLMFARSFNRRKSWRGVAVGMILLGMMFWVACGSVSNAIRSAGTPPGNYTITVTATGTAGTNGGNTSSHPINVALTVQ